MTLFRHDLPRWCIVLVLLAQHHFLWANEINGIGAFTHANHSQFIVQLKAAQASDDVEQLLRDDFGARLSMRITADDLPRRYLPTLWLEGIAVNNDRATMTEQAVHLTHFNNLFRGNLYRGDLVEADYQPQSGLRIALNNIEVNQVDQPDAGHFFRLLLSAWIGDIPVSSSLREALLSASAVHEGLLDEFDTTNYSAQRQQTIRQWHAQMLQELEFDESAEPELAESETAAAQPPPNSQQASPATTTPTPRPENAIVTPGLIPEPLTTEEPNTMPIIAKPAVEQATPEPAQLAMAGGPDTTFTDLAPTQATSNEQSLLEFQEYYNRISEAVLKHQTLPRKAFERRLEGDVRVTVKIDRLGTLLGAELAEPSAHASLNDQAIDAVKNAAPFPPTPESMTEDQYSITVPLRYRLPF